MTRARVDLQRYTSEEWINNMCCRQLDSFKRHVCIIQIIIKNITTKSVQCSWNYCRHIVCLILQCRVIVVSQTNVSLHLATVEFWLKTGARDLTVTLWVHELLKNALGLAPSFRNVRSYIFPSIYCGVECVVH